jgi:multiple sugar transport system substrate-binding protein
MNPVRASAWDDPELSKMVEQWGAEPGQYRAVAEATAEIAEIRYPPHPELTRVLDIWAEAIQKSFFDGNTREHLESARDEIARILTP